MQTPTKYALRSMPNRLSSSQWNIEGSPRQVSYAILSFKPGIAVD